MNRLVLTVLTPVVIGPLTFLAMQWLKKLSQKIDSLPSTAKRIAVMVIASTLTLLGSALGIDFNCSTDATVNCLDTLDKDAVKAVVSAAIAYILHVVKKKGDDKKAGV
jgi:NAD-dependent oxidoreductase involved in siderophore biosynthesis